jgi:hypothetical protein
VVGFLSILLEENVEFLVTFRFLELPCDSHPVPLSSHIWICRRSMHSFTEDPATADPESQLELTEVGCILQEGEKEDWICFSFV